MCSQTGSTGAELLKKRTWYALLIWQRAFSPAEIVNNIDHYTSWLTAICLHGTRGIQCTDSTPFWSMLHIKEVTLPWEQGNIPTIPRPDLPLLPDVTTMHCYTWLSTGQRACSLSTIFFLSWVCLRAACNLYMVNAGLLTFDMLGHSLDLLAGFMTGI